jgi:hypothetical protein
MNMSLPVNENTENRKKMKVRIYIFTCIIIKTLLWKKLKQLSLGLSPKKKTVQMTEGKG